jgi:hypothetical protein
MFTVGAYHSVTGKGIQERKEGKLTVQKIIIIGTTTLCGS